MLRLGVLLAVWSLAAGCQSGRASSLPIGAHAPQFLLAGVDGQKHGLAEYAASPVLAVVFTCNRCPEAQRYEARLQALHEQYGKKGLALVAINPDRPSALRFDELSYTDVGESLEEMKVRATLRHLTYPYLSAEGDERLAKSFDITAMPEMLVFDKARRLQYRGRIDDDPTGQHVTSEDGRLAIEALLAGRPVPVATTRVKGCEPVGPGVLGLDTDLAKFSAQPVAVEPIGADGLKALRRNGTGKLLLINFWATWCAPCVSEFPDLEATFRMYRSRNLEFVSVSTNDPEERPAVTEFLRKQRAAHRNYQFDAADIYALQAAFDPEMPAPVPFTLLLAPNGDVLYQELGASDIPKLRRAILAHLAEDPRSAGQQAYWSQP